MYAVFIQRDKTALCPHLRNGHICLRDQIPLAQALGALYLFNVITLLSVSSFAKRSHTWVLPFVSATKSPHKQALGTCLTSGIINERTQVRGNACVE